MRVDLRILEDSHYELRITAENDLETIALSAWLDKYDKNEKASIVVEGTIVTGQNDPS